MEENFTDPPAADFPLWRVWRSGTARAASPGTGFRPLRRCGAHFLDEENEMEIPGITRQDLYELGLIGCSESSLMREYMKKRFQLPSHLGTSGFLDALNLITTLDEIKQVLNEYTGTS